MLTFNSPAWRWSRACYEAAKIRKGLKDYSPSEDVLVSKLVKFILMRESNIETDRVRAVYPGFCTLTDIYFNLAPACMRFCIEAAALAKAGSDYLVNNLGKNITPTLYSLYKLIFFDVDQPLNQNALMWIEREVLEPAAQYEGPLRQSGYVWKVCALTGGLDKLNQVCLHGEIKDETVGWIKKATITEHLRKTANKIYNPDSLPDVVSVPLAVEDARKLMDLSSTDSDLKNVQSSDNIINKLKSVITLYKEAPLDKKEFAQSEKYTDEDLK